MPCTAITEAGAPEVAVLMDVPDGVRCYTKNSFLHVEVPSSPSALRSRCFSDATHLHRTFDEHESDSTAESLTTPPPTPPLDVREDPAYDPAARAWVPPFPQVAGAARWAPVQVGPAGLATQPQWGRDVPSSYPVGVPHPAAPAAPAAPAYPAFTLAPAAPAPRDADEPTHQKKKRRDVPPPLENEITLMVRNIPNKYTPETLLNTFQEYRQHINFFYLPIDFKNKCNLGYAFVNFGDKEAGHRFASQLQNCKLPMFEKSEKVLVVQAARVQGLSANVKRFRNSSVMGVLPDECKPMLFENGVQKHFPSPGKKLPPVGPRFRPTGQ